MKQKTPEQITNLQNNFKDILQENITLIRRKETRYTFLKKFKEKDSFASTILSLQ